MKKRFISAALMLLMMLSILPAAHADITYPAPSGIEVGSELEHLVAVVTSGTSASATEDSLPAGVKLETSLLPNGLYIYLRGKPTAVGVYDCYINVSVSGGGSNSLICQVRVIPSTPTVSVGPNVRCNLNDTVVLSVNATVSDGGRLSYQWFSNPNNNTSSGALIAGATSATYQAGTALLGTTYYYCVVTNTNNGQTAYATSSTTSVTVEASTVSSIFVQSLPSKTQYQVGDTLDISGLLLNVRYSDGSSAVISEGFSASPTRLDRAGAQTVQLSYQGQTCSFTVDVNPAEEIIDGIGVLTLPSKTEYSIGDTLDTAGLSIRVYTNNGRRDVSSGLECSPSVFEKSGSQVVTISYGGKTCTFTVHVTDEEKPVSLAVFSLPDKTSYVVGDTLDTTGLVIRQHSNKGNFEDISSGFTCSPTRLDTAGRQQIEVKYGELSCRFTVEVQEAAESAPSPSAAPAEPSPSSSPQQAQGSGSKALVVIIIVAAVLALAGLGAYVFIMNRGGAGRFMDRLRAFIDRFRDR